MSAKRKANVDRRAKLCRTLLFNIVATIAEIPQIVQQLPESPSGSETVQDMLKRTFLLTHPQHAMSVPTPSVYPGAFENGAYGFSQRFTKAEVSSFRHMDAKEMTTWPRKMRSNFSRTGTRDSAVAFGSRFVFRRVPNKERSDQW